MIADRLPVGEPFIFSRSRSDCCNKKLSAIDLIPLLSWAYLLGRCRHCKRKISIRYPVTEISSVLIALWACICLPVSLQWIGCIFGWLLLTLSLADIRYYVLPDLMNLVLLLFGFLVVLLFNRDNFFDHALGAIIGFLLLYGASVIYTSLGKTEGLGGGDIKLFAAIGAWVSWTGLPSVLFIACWTAICIYLVKSLRTGNISRKERIPFGPFLCIGAWITWIHGPLEIAF